MTYYSGGKLSSNQFKKKFTYDALTYRYGVMKKNMERQPVKLQIIEVP